MSDKPSKIVGRIQSRLRNAPVANPALLSIDWTDGLSAEQQAELARLVEDANSTLETTAAEAATRGFNTGCFAGLLPGGLMVIVMMVFTGWSFIAAAMGLVLTLVAMVAFASLAAAVTRLNTLRRTYQDTIQSQVDRALDQAGLTQDHFDRAAFQTLPPSAPLLNFLSPTEPVNPEMHA